MNIPGRCISTPAVAGAEALISYDTISSIIISIYNHVMWCLIIYTKNEVH